MPYGVEKSGINPTEKTIIRYGYPASDYPIVNIPYQIYDLDYNSLLPGHYMVVLSPNRKMLHLVESNRIRASVPVAKLIEEMVNEDEEREKIKQQEKFEKKWKNRWNRRKMPLVTAAQKKQADMEASIEDSGADYYILHYKNGNIQADGYIAK